MSASPKFGHLKLELDKLAIFWIFRSYCATHSGASCAIDFTYSRLFSIYNEYISLL